MKLSISFLISLFLLLPVCAQGAAVFLKTGKEAYHPGDEFVAEVRLAKEYDKSSCINAVRIDSAFSSNLIKITGFSRGNSILTLWPKFPESEDIDTINKQGRLSFVGGVPGGYCGILPQDKEKSHPLARIVFQVRKKAAGTAQLDLLGTSAAFLNNGQATKVDPNLRDLSLQIREKEKEEEPLKKWRKTLKADRTPPASFEIKLRQDPEFFDGRYFIVFSTVDKQTGIDHYEIRVEEENWLKAESPYVLEDQKLPKKIQIKAVDKAGNKQTSILELRQPESRYKKLIVWGIIGIGLIMVIYAFWRKIIRRK